MTTTSTIAPALPTVGSLPDGARGFDCNRRLTLAAAQQFVAEGYRFAIRYIRRTAPHDYDLAVGEVVNILKAGLALMPVQHYAGEGWFPDATIGLRYGRTAAEEAAAVGIPHGVTVWCDLEGVSTAVSASAIISYCNNWHAAVASAGYRPGLYVGWRPGLTAVQLYRNLRFDAYWSGYNLNRDQFPAVRGVQMRQFVASADDLVGDFTRQTMDVDVIHADAKGGTPSLLLPAPEILA